MNVVYFGSFRPRKCSGLLIVVDENDLIKRCMYDVKSVLETSQLCRVRHSSIFHLDLCDDVNGTEVDKLVILRAGTNVSEHEQKWIDMLSRVHGQPVPHLVLYLCNNAEDVKEYEETQKQNRQNRFVFLKSDVMTWYARVIEFMFSGQRMEQTNDATCAMVLNQPESAWSKLFQDQALSFLQISGLKSDTQLNKATTVVVLCESLSQSVEASRKEELRRQKLNGCHVYVVSFSYSDDTSDDVKWISTQTYTRNDLCLFVLHLLRRLNRLEINEKLVNSNIKPNCLKGKLKIDKSGTLGRLRLKWQRGPSHCGDSLEYLHIQHRTNFESVWVTLAENLPTTTTVYEVDGLHGDRVHQFQILRETADGVSEPLVSSWFSWQKYSVPRVLWKIFLYILSLISTVLNLPQYLIWLISGLFGLTVDCKEHYSKVIIIQSIFVSVFGISLIVDYALIQDSKIEPIIAMLLVGLYLVFWCSVMHSALFITKLTEHGTLDLPCAFYKKAKSVVIRY